MPKTIRWPDTLDHQDAFIARHIGPNAKEIQHMLTALGASSLNNLLEQTIPQSIRHDGTQTLKAASNEHTALSELKSIASKNKMYSHYIGQGYHPTHLPGVIQRNVLENPGWYTAYTPYQPEIAQGRLEGLLNFQQMAIDLSGMELANASMLDESTAAAEAMTMSKRVARKNKSNTYIVSDTVHPQTLAVVKTRAEHFGFDVLIGDAQALLESHQAFGVLLQYPGTDGRIVNPSAIIDKAHQQHALVTVAADIMSLVLLKPPGEYGADIVVASTQRFGVPMGFGGPHAAFFAFREAYKRAAPGRLIGVSIDARGNTALRMAMQTREQHIRREKANSNICTSQVLPALLSVFYAIYHGPEGLTRIAQRINHYSAILANLLSQNAFSLKHQVFFDTVVVNVGSKQQAIYEHALSCEINLLKVDNDALSISINETTTTHAIEQLCSIFGIDAQAQNWLSLSENSPQTITDDVKRTSEFLTHPTFNLYHSETEMLRYLKRLENKDIALNHAMIPLGSCTMKLNATAEMIPLTWPEFGSLHPFAPKDQSLGYQQLFSELDLMLQCCTGYDAISLQPNAGSQGEYAGLLAIKRYFESKQEFDRTICLIPASAHGTNPASAQMAGMNVVVTACDINGNVGINDLKAKVEQWGKAIAAVMITYPSTHGVFEESITDICDLIHSVGAQVYIDGANMNALVGLASPGKFGGDVSHLNLHKTFCIPHGGGGPGMGPIGVKNHLIPFLPNHPTTEYQGKPNTISAAPWGSASILTISWMYIRMMGREGVRQSSQIAILNANYMATRLAPHFPILYTGAQGKVAHECLLDLRPMKESSGITEEDIAKRLMDFGFHAPTMSFPVAGTLMIEPTESESLSELDRFCDAMIKIKQEISKVENGQWPKDNNPLVNAPHTVEDILAEPWQRPYSKDEAVRPLPYLKDNKVWPSVNRIDNVYGDRHLVCSCVPISDYEH